jgi:hypothetical protein
MTRTSWPVTAGIDPVRYATEMATLYTKLSAEFPDVPAEMINIALEVATHRLVANTRMPNSLPVLVRRNAGAQLDDRVAAAVYRHVANVLAG